MKGYKAFDKDLKCRDFQYEIGQTYEMDGDIECCKRGFHFCETIADCYNFYDMSDDTRICEVEAIGEIKTDANSKDSKYCTNKIKILSEVKNPRIKSNAHTSSTGYCNSGNNNSGNNNSGNKNSGDRNTGNNNSGNGNIGDCNVGYYNNGDWNVGDNNKGSRNSGDWNIGRYNSGIMNKGSRNSGDCNNGNFNTGNYNSGNYNTGERNSGEYNTGDWNKGNCNIGAFNCDTDQKIKMFDKESDWTMKDWRHSKAHHIMFGCPHNYTDHYLGNDQNHEAIFFHEATTEEKQKWWDKLSEDDKDVVKSLPNFDAYKFYLCTGIIV